MNYFDTANFRGLDDLYSQDLLAANIILIILIGIPIIIILVALLTFAITKNERSTEVNALIAGVASVTFGFMINNSISYHDGVKLYYPQTYSKTTGAETMHSSQDIELSRYDKKYKPTSSKLLLELTDGDGVRGSNRTGIYMITTEMRRSFYAFEYKYLQAGDSKVTTTGTPIIVHEGLKDGEPPHIDEVECYYAQYNEYDIKKGADPDAISHIACESDIKLSAHIPKGTWQK